MANPPAPQPARKAVSSPVSTYRSAKGAVRRKPEHRGNALAYLVCHHEEAERERQDERRDPTGHPVAGRGPDPIGEVDTLDGDHDDHGTTEGEAPCPDPFRI